MKFASVSFEAENETHRRPGFLLFLTRVLFDFFSIGMLPITEVIVFPISTFVCCDWRHPIASAAIALILVEVNLVLFSLAIKKSLVGSEWGADHSTPSGPGATSPTSSRRTASSSGAGVLSCSAPGLFSRIPSYGGWDVISATDNRDPANAVLRLERGKLRQ